MLLQSLKTEVSLLKKSLKVNTEDKQWKNKIKQVKSRINCPAVQKKTLDALGLKKLNSVVEHNATPQILGMVEKVKHLVKVVE